MSSSSSTKVGHIVKSGETLDGIARQNNVSREALLAANPDIQDANLIRVDQVIVIPSQTEPAPDSDQGTFDHRTPGIEGHQILLREGEERTMPTRTLKLHDKVPNVSEAEAVGPFVAAILRGSSAFLQLTKNANQKIVFKSEEANKDDDRMMTPRLDEKVNKLADLVEAEFPSLKLRVTEAWDDSQTHAPTSRHLEGRAVDITTSDRDPKNLGLLAGLAVDAGFDWVFFEDKLHVHASVKR